MVSSQARLLSTSHGTNREAFTPAEWGVFLSLVTIWGSSFLFMDIALDHFHPGLVTFLRIALGAGTLTLIPRARRRSVAREDWPRIVILGLIWMALPLSLFPIAQQWINSAVAGMLNGAMPIFTALVATALLRSLPGVRQTAGLLVGFAGLAAVSLPSAGEGGSAAVGVALVVGATVFYAVAANLVTPLQQKYGALPVLLRIQLVATALTLPYGAYAVPRSVFAWSAVFAVAAVGMLGTGVGFVLMGTLSGRVGATRASFISYGIPVVAMILGVVFREDSVEPIAIAGVAAIIVGAFLASRREI